VYYLYVSINLTVPAGVYDIPCKVDVDGSQVEDLY